MKNSTDQNCALSVLSVLPAPSAFSVPVLLSARDALPTTPPPSAPCPLPTLADKDLYSLCKQYGKNARQWSRKFAFLLPEVLKRGLYKKYGYQGINEFAAKLCGMSREVVERVLLLSKKLNDKPLIWNKLEVYGWTKLLLVARVVGVDTQDFWLDKLERLTYRGLAEYVQVWRKGQIGGTKPFENTPSSQMDFENFSGDKSDKKCKEYALCKPKNSGAFEFVTEDLSANHIENIAEIYRASGSPHGKSYKKFKFNLDADTEFRLKSIKKQLEKERGAVTFGETLSYVLKKLEELEAKVESVSFEAKEPPLRCSFPGCNEPYDEKHHPFRSSLSKNNKNLTPLCRKHHHLAHSGLIENEKQSPEKWRIQTKELPAQLQYYLDQSFTAKADLTVRRYLIDS